ncbi:serine--tRNA ligase [Parvibaculum sedimenti]|uniref:Serine--tRNA ligase n=1 Tax=Parvibaculum sedimenti TaxID=2608632 RepID=A0A6N6VK09_9HYPH|nr:serine--tRNA ligase [Parvibaculum sedimenti]KAB7739637.1 serine--tRNA ligase [Parvibaculum sedimenti]
MHDIKIIRDDPQAFDAGLAKRGLPPQSARLIEIDERRRKTIAALQEMQQQRNDASKQIGAAKAKKDEALAQKLLDEVAHLKAKIQAGEDEERAISTELETELGAIPNIPYDNVPVGPDETANVEYRRHGAPREMNFPPKEHFDLGEALGLMDFETAAKLSGARFAVLKGQLARLERAIGNFMLNLHTGEFGYTEVNPPLLVKDSTMYGTAQLPKFADDQFAVFKGQSREDQDRYWLIPTAEVSLTNLVRESILSEDELPLRLTAWTPCFRAEAGSAGRDTRGLIRQHQFSKVELVSITTPEQADEEHERMLACAEGVLKALDLHYRVVTLCTGDMGFSSRKTYDIEVWLPGQNMFREISSCSVCGDFQARRMQARYRPVDSKNTRFVNTLNGSGLAVGRTLVAILENYQQADGSITVPSVLRPYMGGQEVISANG